MNNGQLHQPSIGRNWLYRTKAERLLGPGRLSSVAVYPYGIYVAADGGTWLHLYQRHLSEWLDPISFDASAMGLTQFYNPHIEAESDGTAWISGCVFGAQVGAGTAVKRLSDSQMNISVRRIQGAWDQGNLSLSGAPGEAVWYSANGYWQRLRLSSDGTSVVTIESGQMFAGKGGEKQCFDIADNGIWHAAIGGYPAWDSSYRNSLMTSPATWAVDSLYSAGDDGCYVSVAAALAGQRAFMCGAFPGRGVCVNAWKSGEMSFDPSLLLTVDPSGTSGLRRFAPQLVPASRGVFCLFTKGDGIYARYLTVKGVDSKTLRIGDGSCASGAFDGSALHVAYQRDGNIYYRRIRVLPLASGG